MSQRRTTNARHTLRLVPAEPAQPLTRDEVLTAARYDWKEALEALQQGIARIATLHDLLCTEPVHIDVEIPQAHHQAQSLREVADRLAYHLEMIHTVSEALTSTGGQ